MELTERIISEAHNIEYSIHPEGTKMYRDLTQTFWWSDMKRDIDEYVSKCRTCQRVKAKHQRPIGELKPLETPKWNVTPFR